MLNAHDFNKMITEILEEERGFPEVEKSPFTSKDFPTTSYHTREENLSYRLGIHDFNEMTTEILEEERGFPEFEKSPFTLKGFLATSYHTREENLSYRLGIIQGTECYNISSYCSELQDTINFVTNELHNAIVLDMRKIQLPAQAQASPIERLEKMFFDEICNYKAFDAIKLVTTLKTFTALDMDAQNKVFTLAKQLHKMTTKATKVLAFNATNDVEYLALLFLALCKVDVLIINPTDNYAEGIEVGQITNLPYRYPLIISLDDIRKYREAVSDIVCSSSYTAEKAVIDRLNTELNVVKDGEHKVVHAKMSVPEILQLSGQTYKAKQDYLGIKANDTYTYLPTLFACLRGNILSDSERKLKAIYKQLHEKATIIFKDGIGIWAEEVILQESLNALEAHATATGLTTAELFNKFIAQEDVAIHAVSDYIKNINSTLSDRSIAFIVKQFHAILTAESIKGIPEVNQLKILLACLKALPSDIFNFIQNRTWISETPVFLYYMEDYIARQEYNYHFIYLTLIAYLGFDVICLDPYKQMPIVNTLKPSVYVESIGPDVSKRFKYKYREPLFRR